MSAELVTARCRYDVATTVKLLTTALQRRNITLFATIYHAAGARAAGLQLPDEVVVIFGNPAAGTPLMQADPRAGIDLPLRILVWFQDGQTWVAFRDPHTMAGDFSLTGRTDNIDKLRGVLDGLVAEVAS